MLSGAVLDQVHTAATTSRTLSDVTYRVQHLSVQYLLFHSHNQAIFEIWTRVCNFCIDLQLCKASVRTSYDTLDIANLLRTLHSTW